MGDIEMTLQEIIGNWKEEAGLNRDYLSETTCCHQEGTTLYIITKRPGLWIGLHGRLSDKYREILKPFGIEHLNFVEAAYTNIRMF